MPTTARAIVFEAPRSLSVRPLELKPVERGDLEVEVSFSGISTGTERLLWDGTMPPFRGLGYPLVELSSKGDVTPLLPYLKGQRSLLTGQSGMGKSTLVKALVPDAEVRIREISHFLDAGKQSTTGSRLFELAPGTEIIDSPGVAEFGLAGFDAPAIGAGFREFGPHRGHCRFQNCSHLVEPGCALQAAADSGAIHPRRLALYQRIVRAEAAPGRR